VTDIPLSNYIGGLGGEDISGEDILGIYEELRSRGGNERDAREIRFLGISC
jgi:hypothetical protein